MLSFTMDAKRIYRRNGLSSKRNNKYLHTTYKTAVTSTNGNWRTFTYLLGEKVSYVSLYQDSSRKKISKKILWILFHI